MTLSARVIPCLDIRDGEVVKGIRFQQLRLAGDPVEAAIRYEAQGGDELVVLDVSATPEGRGHAVDTVRRVRPVLSIPMTVGGGVRQVDDAARLLEVGADKVGVNTAAIRRPELIGEMAGRFGAQCMVLAVDAAATSPGSWEVVVESGTRRTGLDVVDWCAKGASLGAGEILLTSWDRDGTRLGYDTAVGGRGVGRSRCPGDRLGWRSQCRPHGRRPTGGGVGGAGGLRPPRRRRHDRRHQGRSRRGGSGGAAVIIPSIDISRGRAVQLVEGEALALEAGDPGRSSSASR